VAAFCKATNQITAAVPQQKIPHTVIEPDQPIAVDEAEILEGVADSPRLMSSCSSSIGGCRLRDGSNS
jgi:hypothetical protein